LNIFFGEKFSSDENKSINLLTIDKLIMKYKDGNYYVGSVLNVNIVSGIVKLFNIFILIIMFF
jgi:hypothetical protein